MQHKRKEHREAYKELGFPVSCVFRLPDSEHLAEVVNYHYRGACLKLTAAEDIKRLENAKLDFYLGKNLISKDTDFKIKWHDTSQSMMIGLEFQKPFNTYFQRTERFPANPNFPPIVLASDPLDPNRQIFFQIKDFSHTGLLLASSLTNRHLLPGMEIKNAKVNFPGNDNPMVCSLYIENTRVSSNQGQFLLGVSLNGDRSALKKAIKQYLSLIGNAFSETKNEWIENLAASGNLNRKLKGDITYRIIKSKHEYEDVLKLRYGGYAKHKKVSESQTWQDQGEGLDQEGLILGGYISGALVCSMEMRFGDQPLPFRVEKWIDRNQLPKTFDPYKTVEINKLVVHPKAQGTDAVLGLIQRAHAIVINRGLFDVLLVATDQLKKLYLNVGATDLNVRFPHPVVKDGYLNLMLVSKETYHDGANLNPYSWDLVYRATHEYFSQLGIASQAPYKTKSKIIRTAFGLYLSNKRKLTQFIKRLRKKSSEYKDERSLQRIDPKWTQQDIVATVMYPYLLEAFDMIGKGNVLSILEEIGTPLTYFQSQSNWLSVDFLDRFLDSFAKHGSVKELSLRAGHRSMERDVLGLKYHVLKHFVTPDFAFHSFAKIASQFNKTRTYSVYTQKSGRAVVSLGLNKNGKLPQHQASCDNWQASFESYIRLMTGKKGHVKKTSCMYEGAKECTYEILWQPALARYSTVLQILAINISSAGLYAFQTFHDTPHPLFNAVAVSALGVIAILAFRLFSTLKEQKKSEEAYVKFLSEANEKYQELQQVKIELERKYQEAKLLESASRSIQKNTQLDDILNAALQSICENFQFKRAFIMLADEEHRTLRTAALVGVSDHTQEIWKFSVEVTVKKDNPQLLSSVYHTGQSILINDVKAHLFQLNEQSRALIQKLRTSGFIIVQIPASTANKAWGVMVADRSEGESTLTRKDIVLLERVAMQIGLVLDKQAQIEYETNLKNIFKKFVPQEVLAMADQANSLTLGGQMRRIACMVIDIRGFTSISNEISPPATLDLLNRFFKMIETNLRISHGNIDKFLGDGALITWGAVGTNELNGNSILRSIFAIFDDLVYLNKSFSKKGLPALKVGVGLHFGEALVGNIGSESRMEFTSIGSVVNVASRLETLCKELSTQLIVSEDFFSQLDVAIDLHWKKIESQEIRGLKNPITVYQYIKSPDNLLRNDERKVA